MQRTSAILLVAALVLAGLSGWLLWRTANNAPLGPGAEQSVSLGGPFALIDQNGRPKTDRDFHGRWTLLYFGYTYCPDVCPTTLAMIEKALAKMGPPAQAVTPVFVSVDPERDTPSVLKAYLKSFGPQFVGLTGSPAQVAQVAKAYRVYYAKQTLPGGTYAVEHSSVIYLLDPKGRLVKVYDDQTQSADLAKDLNAVIASGAG